MSAITTLLGGSDFRLSSNARRGLERMKEGAIDRGYRDGGGGGGQAAGVAGSRPDSHEQDGPGRGAGSHCAPR